MITLGSWTCYAFRLEDLQRVLLLLFATRVLLGKKTKITILTYDRLPSPQSPLLMIILYNIMFEKFGASPWEETGLKVNIE